MGVRSADSIGRGNEAKEINIFQYHALINLNTILVFVLTDGVISAVLLLWHRPKGESNRCSDGCSMA